MTEESEEKKTLSNETADDLIKNGYGQYAWYASESDKAEKKLARVTWAGIITGFLASALAALPSSLMNENITQLTRWIVAVLTLLTTLFSGTLASKYRGLALARERGRVATALVNNTTLVKLKFHHMTRREWGDLLENFERRLLEIETQNGTLDPKIASESHSISTAKI